MLRLIAFQLLIERLYLAHVMLFHGCNAVDSSICLQLPSNRLLSPIDDSSFIPFCALVPRLHFLFSLARLLLVSLLKYALVVLDLPLQISLKRTHPVLNVHLSHYRRMREVVMGRV